MRHRNPAGASAVGRVKRSGKSRPEYKRSDFGALVRGKYTAKAEAVYYYLSIVATSPATEIWLGDDDGHLVQKETGKLKTSVLAGHYTVEFGLGTTPYPIHLVKASRYTQAELAAGPTCSRPISKLRAKSGRR